MKKLYPLLIVLSLIGGIMPASAQRSTKARNAPVAEGQKQNIFAGVEASSDGRGVFVHWQMSAETDNVGFNVVRDNSAGEQIVNPFIILGSRGSSGADMVSGTEYSFFDRTGRLGDAYRIECIGSGVRSVFSDKASSEYTSNISAIAGRTYDQLSSMSERRKTNFASSDLSLPADLASEIGAATAAADPDMQKIIAGRPGVKLGVKSDGFYHVNRAQLETAGFNVASDPAMWQLFADGVEQAISIVGNGDQIEFLGRAKETTESDLHYYYLIVGDTAGLRIGMQVSRGPGVSVAAPNYRQTSYIKERIYYISDIINGPDDNVWGRIVGTTGANFNFTLTGIDPTADEASVTVKVQGFSTGAQSVGFTLNGQPLPSTAGNGPVPMTTTATLPVSALVEGTNVLNMITNVSGDYVLFDSVSVDYSRKFLANQNQVTFYTTNYRSANVTGFSTSNVRMFDTSFDGRPVEITNLRVSPDSSGYSIDIPAYRSRRLYALDSSAIRNVDAIEANTPSAISTPSHAANLVIITYPAFAAQANAWADYRRGQGFSVEVVDVKDIYDEFSYGQPSSVAINSFLQYAWTNWQTPPAYALILGRASYDAKNYEGLGYLNLVPTMFVNTVYSETGSDEALADFNGDGLAEMAIGRIPATTAADVTKALAKVQGFEKPAMQTLNRGTIFAYDDPIGYDFASMSAELKNDLPAGTPNVMIGRSSADAQTNLVNEINNGRYLVNYSGHGTSTTWAASSFFGYLNVPSLTNTNNQSIFTMLTCLNGYFVNPNTDSLAERLVKANGGAVSAWASSGKTTPDVQMVMGNRFYTQIGLGNTKRIGDLVKDAKTMIPGGTDVRYSWVLLGDPMLQVRQ
jgi:Peptidase family C25